MEERDDALRVQQSALGLVQLLEQCAGKGRGRQAGRKCYTAQCEAGVQRDERNSHQAEVAVGGGAYLDRDA